MANDRPCGLAVAQRITLETVVQTDNLASRLVYPAIRIIGAGEVGLCLLDSLARERIGRNTQLIRAVPGGEARAARDVDGTYDATLGSESSLFARMRDSDVVLILADANDVAGLQTAESVATAAKWVGAIAIVMLTQELTTPVDRRLIAGVLHHCADVIFILPVAPHASVIRALLAACIHAAATGVNGRVEPTALVGADFRDVRLVFAGCTHARIGIGHSDRADREYRAVDMALAHIGPRNIRQASGVLTLVGGSRSLRLREIADIADAVHANVPADARTTLGVHHDDGLGEILRVTIIAAGALSGTD